MRKYCVYWSGGELLDVAVAGHMYRLNWTVLARHGNFRKLESSAYRYFGDEPFIPF